MKKKFVDYFMKVAYDTAELSYAQRKKVGAIIVKDGKQIVSIGYNGTPEGWDNCCEDKNNNTRSEVIHAEENAITKIARSTFSSQDCDIFITLSCCEPCAKLIVGAGIKKVYYDEEYRDVSGLKYLIKCGVEIIKYNV